MENEARFTFASVNNGEAIERVNKLMERAAQDIYDRPEVVKAREVNIKITLTPKGKICDVIIKPSIKLPEDQPFKDICSLPESDGSLHQIGKMEANAHGQKHLPFIVEE